MKELHNSYAELAQATKLSVSVVKQKRIKYRDGVTRALAKWKADIMNNTHLLPVPALKKLLAFSWLFPHCVHYDAKIMGDRNLLDYYEKFLAKEQNHARRYKDQQKLLECDRLEKDFLKATGRVVPVLQHADIIDYARDVCVLVSGQILRFNTNVDDIPVCDTFAAMCFSPDPPEQYSPVTAFCHEVRVPHNSILHKLWKVASTRFAMVCAEKCTRSATRLTLDSAAAHIALMEIKRCLPVKDLIPMHTELSLVLCKSDFEAKGRKMASLVKSHCDFVVQHFKERDACMTMLTAPVSPSHHPSLNSMDIESLRQMRAKSKIFYSSFWKL